MTRASLEFFRPSLFLRGPMTFHTDWAKLCASQILVLNESRCKRSADRQPHNEAFKLTAGNGVVEPREPVEDL